MRSNTCIGNNGRFLEEFHSQTAAQLAIHPDPSMKFQPYQCRQCGYWHLRIENTRRQCQYCTDSALFLKDIYATKIEAESTAAWLKKEKKVQLLPYKCPHGSGWHLTKKK